MNPAATDPTERLLGNTSAPGSEWSLLCAACSGLSGSGYPEGMLAVLRAPIDWKALFHLADHHRVLPLLYKTLSGVGTAVPAQEMQTLERHFQINLHKAMFLSRELLQIVDQLSNIGFEFLTYKGLALAQMVYGDIALRQTGDIDLLIRTADLPRIRDAVRELGYTPHSRLREPEEQAYLKSGYECAFDGPVGPNLLEVQWAIQPRFYAVDLDIGGVFQRAVTVSVASRTMKTPCLEDLFIVLSLHAAKHVWGRLAWICDLARIMQLTSLKWEWIGSQAKELRVVRILRLTMLLANRLLGTAIPGAADASLPEDAETRELARQIETQIASDQLYDVESFAYFRLMMRLRENNTDRLRFLSRLAWTPGPGEWDAIRLPRRLFPLYRVVRLSRLAARVVRTQLPGARS